jgi:DNA-binding LacI/PurR family transcriptional regulator
MKLVPQEKNGVSNGKVTLRDIARIANVSPSTVSRVLNNDANAHMISEETRLRIRTLATELGYRPNPVARALAGGHSHLIGLIVRAIADPFFAQLIEELTSCARARGYQLVLGYIHDADEIAQMSSILDMRHIDGVIVLGELQENDEYVLQNLLEQNRFMVGLCRHQTASSLITVRTDNSLGTHLLFDHLVALGHRRIAFLDGSWLGDIELRRKTYQRCMEENGLAIHPDWIQVTINDVAGGFEGMQRLLRLPEPPSAVMTADDSMAVGAIKAAHEAGYRVPEDISVVGFDDIEIAGYTIPGLTTIHQPIDQLAASAIDSILGLIHADEVPTEHSTIRVTPTLVVRQSTGNA